MRDLVRDNRNGKVPTLRVVIRRTATQDDSHDRGDSRIYTTGKGEKRQGVTKTHAKASTLS